MQRLVKKKLGKVVTRQDGNKEKELGITVVRPVGRKSGRMMEAGIPHLMHLPRQPEATTKVDTSTEVLLHQPEVITKVTIGRKNSDNPERERRLRRQRRRRRRR